MPLGTILQFPFGGALTAANLNAPVNSLKTLVDAWYDAVPTTYFTSANMVSTSTPNKGVLRDANAAFQAGELFLKPARAPGSGGIALLLQSFDATTQLLIIGQTNTGLTRFSIDSAGAAMVQSLSIPGTPLGAASGGTGKATNTAGRLLLGNGTSAINELAGAADGQAPVWSSAAGGAWAAGFLPLAALADYKVTPSTAGQVNVAAGDGYEDSGGKYVAAAAATVAPLPTQPAGANTQYVAFTKAPVTGNVTRTDGVVNDPLSALTIPTANRPLAVVVLRGVTSNPGYVIAAADILDIRHSIGVGGAGGGGGSGGIATSTAVLTSGDYTATLANSRDVTDPTENLAIQPVLTRYGTVQASIADILRTAVSGTIKGSLSPAGGSIQLNTVAGPVAISSQGIWNAITAAITTTNAAAGGAATYKLLATMNAAATAFTISLTTGSVGANQLQLANLRWDGTQWQLGLIDWSPIMPVADSSVWRPIVVSTLTVTSTLVNTVAFTALSGVTPQIIHFPVPMRGFLIGNLYIRQPAANPATAGQVAVMVDGGPVGLSQTLTNVLASSTGSSTPWAPIESSPLAAGQHSITLCGGQATAPATFNVDYAQLYGIFYAA
jgi:hypothetical protein